jgi:hypothetical protein
MTITGTYADEIKEKFGEENNASGYYRHWATV